MNIARFARSLTLALVAMLLAACGGAGGDAGPPSYSCPDWNLNDSLEYLKTTTVGGSSTTESEQFVVTERTPDMITLTDGITIKNYFIVNGVYIDEQMGDLGFCPPPTVGSQEQTSEWVPGPTEGTGAWITTTWLVTGTTAETVRVPAGGFSAMKIVVSTTSVYTNTTTPAPERPDSIITRYYVGDVGDVKRVVETPATSSIVTEEMTAYHYP